MSSDTLDPDTPDPSALPQAVAAMDPALLRQQVEDVLAAARPAIQRDGGDIVLAAIESAGVVRVRLSGACTHCKLAGQTLGGIRRQLTQVTGIPLRVLPALS